MKITVYPNRWDFSYSSDGSPIYFKLYVKGVVNISPNNKSIDIWTSEFILKDCHIQNVIVDRNTTNYQILGSTDIVSVDGLTETYIEGIASNFESIYNRSIRQRFKDCRRKVYIKDVEKVKEILGPLSKITYEEYQRQLLVERI